MRKRAEAGFAAALIDAAMRAHPEAMAIQEQSILAKAALKQPVAELRLSARKAIDNAVALVKNSETRGNAELVERCLRLIGNLSGRAAEWEPPKDAEGKPVKGPDGKEVTDAEPFDVVRTRGHATG